MIVYDRFGMHEKEVRSLIKLPGVDYYPFTGNLRKWRMCVNPLQLILLSSTHAVYQLTQPTKYNKEYALKQVSIPESLNIVFGHVSTPILIYRTCALNT